MKSNILNIKNLIQGFKLSCQAENKSPKTIEWYNSFLERFAQFLIIRGLPTDIADISTTNIRLFIRYLQTEAKVPNTAKPLSAATVQGYTRTLKAFFSWLMREDYITSNPMTKIPIPKGEHKIVNTFSNEQIAKLLNICQLSDGTGYRNLTIILLLLDSGLRVSELININLEDVNLTQGYITIRRGKGFRERVVPIGSLVQKSIWKYLNTYRPQPLTEKINNLFLSNDGLPLTRNGIQYMIRRYSKRAGISGVRCSPHTFRHSFARNYLVNGGDVFSLQKILGHSSLASVRAYLNLFTDDIKRQHQRFSPVDNLVQSQNLYTLVRASTNRRR